MASKSSTKKRKDRVKRTTGSSPPANPAFAAEPKVTPCRDTPGVLGELPPETAPPATASQSARIKSSKVTTAAGTKLRVWMSHLFSKRRSGRL